MMPPAGELHDVVAGVGEIRMGEVGSHSRVAEVLLIGCFNFEAQRKSFARVVLVFAWKHLFGGRVQEDKIHWSGASEVDLEPHRGVGLPHHLGAIRAIRLGRSGSHPHPAEVGSECDVLILGSRQPGANHEPRTGNRCVLNESPPCHAHGQLQAQRAKTIAGRTRSNFTCADPCSLPGVCVIRPAR